MVKSMAVPGDATIRNEENPAELASGRRGREFDSRRHGRLSDTAGASERETWAVAMLKLGCWLAAMVALLGLGSVPVEAQVRITEFMASNTHTLADEDGDSSDWIEIQNTTAADVNLLNWALTDSAGNPGKWPFPATNMTPGGFLVVFASGKDRRLPGAPLHANFKLDSAGEYLALFRPDGTAATEIWPAYPAQFPDVSYGLAMQLATAVLVASNAPVLYRIPASAADDADWTQPGFTSAGWEGGTNGLGYETGLPEPEQESFAAKVLATGPVAYWRLNETSGAEAVNSGTGGVSDEGGYEGAILLGKAGPRPPEFATMEANNTAPFFDGVSACVNGPFELVNALPAFTLAGWINPTAAQPNRTGLFGQNDTIEFGFISPGVIQVWTAYGSVTAGYPFPNNQWHYVTATGGNGLLALYFDGRLAGATPASPANFGESEFNFNIGGGGVFDPTGNYFQGLIDEVAVWFRALATNEIAALLATNAGQVDYAPYIATDVRTQMLGSNSTAYVRIPFTVADPGAFGSLKLLVRYDDGFAAFLNGYRIASSNAPTALRWNSAATQPHPDAEAVQWESFDVSAALPYLQPGSNVLAVQGLNIAATNTDFLLQVQLLAGSVTASTDLWRFFTLPTPGGPNGTGANDLGPIPDRRRPLARRAASRRLPYRYGPGGAGLQSALPGHAPLPCHVQSGGLPVHERFRRLQPSLAGRRRLDRNPARGYRLAGANDSLLRHRHGHRRAGFPLAASPRAERLAAVFGHNGRRHVRGLRVARPLAFHPGPVRRRQPDRHPGLALLSERTLRQPHHLCPRPVLRRLAQERP